MATRNQTSLIDSAFGQHRRADTIVLVKAAQMTWDSIDLATLRRSIPIRYGAQRGVGKRFRVRQHSVVIHDIDIIR